MLLQESVGGGAGALVVAERVALALLQADLRQTLETVVLEKRVQQSDRALYRSAVGRAVNNDILAEGSAVAEIELVVIRVSQQDAGFQQLQDSERGQLTDLAIARARR